MRGGQGKRLLFCVREKLFSRSGGKTSQEGISAWENPYRQQTCRPYCALESNDVFTPDWSLPGVLDREEKESAQTSCGLFCIPCLVQVACNCRFWIWCSVPIQPILQSAPCLSDISKFRSKLLYSSASTTELGVTGDPAWLLWNSLASTTLKLKAGNQRSLQTHRSVCMSLSKPQLTASWTSWQLLKVMHTRSNFSWNCPSF